MRCIGREIRCTSLTAGTSMLVLVGAATSSADTSNFDSQWAREVETGRADKRLPAKAGQKLIRAKLRALDGPRSWSIKIMGDVAGLGEHQFSATTLTEDGPYVRTGTVNLRANPTITQLGFTGRSRSLGRVGVTTRLWKQGHYEPLPGPTAPIRPPVGRLSQIKASSPAK